MRPVFGIDGGGSSVRLRVDDGEGRAIWEGRGAGINPNATPQDAIAERLAALFSEARKAAGLGPADFAAGCLGIAGADRKAEKAELEALLRARLGLACPLEIVADCDIALVGGLKRLEGYLLIAGTGSIAIARAADGTRFRSGGLGHFLGDEGSAFFVGFQAIRRSLRSAEGRDLPTAMLGPLVERFGLEDETGFVGLVYRRFDKALIAKAADIVEAHRAAGDELAASIMNEARDELALLVGSVRERAAGAVGDGAIVLWGGLLDHNDWLKGALSEKLAETCPGLEPTSPLESAAYGACMLARRLASTTTHLES